MAEHTELTTTPGALAEGEQESLGAKLVQKLFDRHHVGNRDRSRLVEQLLNLSYASAHRRVKGSAPWTLEELSLVAAHFGESLTDLILSDRLSVSHAASFVVGGYRSRCAAWLGEPLPAGAAVAPETLVAVRVASDWVVTTAKDSASFPGGSETSSVQSVLLEVQSTHAKRIAVLDDNEDITSSVCHYLQASGFDAQAFSTFESLSSAIRERSFDAYIIDWLIENKTARALIAEIRAADAHCPIAVLTGQIEAGRADASDVADALTTYQLQYFEKPVGMSIIAATLSRLIDAQRPREGPRFTRSTA